MNNDIQHPAPSSEPGRDAHFSTSQAGASSAAPADDNPPQQAPGQPDHAQGAPDAEPWPFPTADHHPPPEPAKPLPVTPTEDALDHGIEESFPASDPVSVTTVPTESQEPDSPAQPRSRDSTDPKAGRKT